MGLFLKDPVSNAKDKCPNYCYMKKSQLNTENKRKQNKLNNKKTGCIPSHFSINVFL